VAAILFGMNTRALGLGSGWLLAGVAYWTFSARHAADRLRGEALQAGA